MQRIIRNPKNGEEIDSPFDDQQAYEIVSKLKSNGFAQSLCRQFHQPRGLSITQGFWMHKLAMDNSQPKELEIQLYSNLQEFISHTDLLQFRVEEPEQIQTNEDGSITTIKAPVRLGKVFLLTKQDGIVITLGFRYVGKIIGDKLYYSVKAPNIVAAEIMVMSKNPMLWMQRYGLATGECCVCGRQLTNEESVSLGIGPICRGKWGN